MSEAGETERIHCEQRCPIPAGVNLAPVPQPRHAWADVLRCPNGGCGRCFLVTKTAIGGTA